MAREKVCDWENRAFSVQRRCAISIEAWGSRGELRHERLMQTTHFCVLIEATGFESGPGSHTVLDALSFLLSFNSFFNW